MSFDEFPHLRKDIEKFFHKKSSALLEKIVVIGDFQRWFQPKRVGTESIPPQSCPFQLFCQKRKPTKNKKIEKKKYDR
jgi:hypothetical protein